MTRWHSPGPGGRSPEGAAPRRTDTGCICLRGGRLWSGPEGPSCETTAPVSRSESVHPIGLLHLHQKNDHRFRIARRLLRYFASVYRGDTPLLSDILAAITGPLRGTARVNTNLNTGAVRFRLFAELVRAGAIEFKPARGTFDQQLVETNLRSFLREHDAGFGRFGRLLDGSRLQHHRLAIFAPEYKNVDAGGRFDICDRVSARSERAGPRDSVFGQVHGDGVHGRGRRNSSSGAEQGCGGTRISEARNRVFHFV